MLRDHDRRGSAEGSASGWSLLRVQRLSLLPALVLAAGCASTASLPSTPPLEVSRHETLRATLWVQTAAEFPALFLQACRGGMEVLPRALADVDWTAAPVEQRSGYQDLPPAVILDIDETVLDNSPYQARRIGPRGDFTPESWRVP